MKKYLSSGNDLNNYFSIIAPV